MASVSIIVGTRNRPVLLADCVRAVTDALREGDELVVVDSASDDAARVAAVADEVGARLVRCDRPGLSLARNTGISAATKEILAFTDDDCRPAPDYCARLDEAFADGVDFVTGSVEAVGETTLAVSVVTADRARELGPGTDPASVGAGASMSVRRRALLAIGDFDEMLGAGSTFRSGEDLDLFLRLLHTGHLGRYEPAVRVGHVQWRSRREAVRLGWNYGLGGGAVGVKARRIGAGNRLLHERIGRDGLGAMWRALRNRHLSGLQTAALQTAGAVVGAVWAARLADDGRHFVSRTAGRPTK